MTVKENLSTKTSLKKKIAKIRGGGAGLAGWAGFAGWAFITQFSDRKYICRIARLQDDDKGEREGLWLRYLLRL